MLSGADRAVLDESFRNAQMGRAGNPEPAQSAGSERTGRPPGRSAPARAPSGMRP